MRNWSIADPAALGMQVAVTAASQAVSIAPTVTAQLSDDVMIDNPGPNDVYVRAGFDNTVTATTACLRVPAGSLQPYYKGRCTHLALICASGLTQTVLVHVGAGQ